MEMIGKDAVELDQMTLSEICVACTDPEQEAKAEAIDGVLEAEAYFDWWHSLTEEERLFAEFE